MNAQARDHEENDNSRDAVERDRVPHDGNM